MEDGDASAPKKRKTAEATATTATPTIPPGFHLPTSQRQVVMDKESKILLASSRPYIEFVDNDVTYYSLFSIYRVAGVEDRYGLCSLCSEALSCMTNKPNLVAHIKSCH